jgi:branched-chain amino acid transport system permease protein
MDQFTGLLVAGLTTGAVYALVAMSFSVVFATTGVLNFAQGELFMVGAMLCAVLYGEAGMALPPALLITVGSVAVIAVVEERLAVRPALRQGKGAMSWVLATLGTAIALGATFALVFSPRIRQPPPVVDDTPRSVLGITISLQQVSLIGTAVVVAVLLYVFYQRTLVGVAMRAVSQDAEAASMRGIGVSALGMTAFAVSGAVVGLTGFLAAPLFGAYPAMGFAVALQGFIAAAAGGIMHVKGAVVGGFALGLIESYGSHLIGAGYRTAILFVVLIAVLAIRPAGLFGRLTARAV